MDLITQLPLTEDGWDPIFIMVDCLTKKMHECPTTTDVTAPRLAQLFINTIYRHRGLREVIVSMKSCASLEAVTSVSGSGACMYHVGQTIHQDKDGIPAIFCERQL